MMKQSTGNRHFCMLDTINVLSNRLIVNVQTRCNVQQAVAENLCPNLTHEQRVKHASKPSSDYIDLIWMKQFQVFECVISIESGKIEFDDGSCYHPDQTIHMKEHQFNNRPDGVRHNLLKHKDAWDMNVSKHGQLDILTKHIHISNIDDVPPARQEYYKRSSINHEITCTMITHPDITIHTCSRKCDLQVDFVHDWVNCTGALIQQSDLNRRDHLKHVI